MTEGPWDEPNLPVLIAREWARVRECERNERPARSPLISPHGGWGKGACNAPPATRGPHPTMGDEGEVSEWNGGAYGGGVSRPPGPVGEAHPTIRPTFPIPFYYSI